jgi:hypothetical protein
MCEFLLIADSCPVGSYYYNSSYCKPCPLGFYQDQEASSECKQCPENMNTTFEGARSTSECRSIYVLLEYFFLYFV